MKRLALWCLALSVAAALQASTSPPPTFDFEGVWSRPLSFREGGGTAAITVFRSGDFLSETVSVDYSWIIYGFGVGHGTLTFGPNETQKTFPMTLPPDDGVFTAGFDGEAYLSVNGTNVSFRDLVITDAEPQPTLTADPVSVPEGNSGTTTVNVHFKLSGPIARVTYPWITSGGTATRGTDYQPGNWNITVPANRTEFDVPVTIIGDTEGEPDETVTIHCEINYPASHISGDGVLTILNDEFLLDTPNVQIPRGTSGSVQISTSVAAASTEHVTLASDTPAVASVPSFIDIPAGATSASIPVTGESVGAATISATLPASRSGGTLTATVFVFNAASLSVDPLAIDMALGTQTSAHLQLAPPPAAPVTLNVVNGNAKAVDVPATVAIGTDGNGSLPIRAIGAGWSFVRTTLPPEYGGASNGIGVTVSQPTGLAITSLSAASGPQSGSQAITVRGNNITGRCTITFGGVPALNTAAAASGAITTQTPPHAPGVVDVAIRCGTDMFTFAGAYTYVAAPPLLTAIAPTTGSINGGTVVMATGQNMPRGRCGLWFGNTPAETLTNLESTQMSAIAPPSAAGGADVTLRCGSDTSTLNGAFTYGGDEPAANIAVITPSSGAPGDRVRLGGSRFRASDAIAFGDAPAIDMTTDATTHVVTVPDVAPGAVSVMLRDTDGRTISAPPFTVLAAAPPQITAAPAKATVGSEIVVSGGGFRPSVPFSIGGVSLQSVVVTSTYAIVRLPASIAPGVTTLATGSATWPIEVTSTGVAVTSVSPQCVSAEGGALVTINGSGFSPGAVVTFGIADAAEVTVRDGKTIVARAPASSGVSDATITVTNPSLDSGELTGFRYRWPASECGAMKHRAAGR